MLEAAQLLRANDYGAADAMLVVLCPDGPSRSDQATCYCALRTAGLAEARRLRDAKDLALMYWLAGDLLAKARMPDAALEAFRKSLDIRPDDPAVWYSIGHAQRDRKDLEAAAAAFARVLELQPNDATSLYWLATNLMDQGMLADAEAMLDRVLLVDPKNIRVPYRRGEIQMRLGEYVKAIESFEKAKDLGVDAGKVRARIKECKEALARQAG